MEKEMDITSSTAESFSSGEAMSTNIDPIEFGKLIQSMQNLNTSVTKLTDRVEELENKLSSGKGVVLGLMIAAGGVGSMSHVLVEKFLK